MDEKETNNCWIKWEEGDGGLMMESNGGDRVDEGKRIKTDTLDMRTRTRVILILYIKKTYCIAISGSRKKALLLLGRRSMQRSGLPFPILIALLHFD
jgi:hypothetical protein